MSNITVLFLDKEEKRRNSFKQICEERERIKAHTTDSISEGLKYAEDANLVVSAFSLKDGNGPEMFEKTSKKKGETGYVLYTDKDDRLILAEIGETPFLLVKPSRLDLSELVDKLVEMHDNRGYSSYPTVSDEKSRFLEAEDLQISSDKQEELDEIAEAVKDEFGADKTYIEIMKASEQDFLSTCGFDQDTSLREPSICTHTLLHDGVYVIENVQEDLRFQNNDFVNNLDIGFYAGAILKVDGYRVGTLCVIDSEPHGFTEEKIKKLREYADRAENILQDVQ